MNNSPPAPHAPERTGQGRTRSSDASKGALLAAAQELFGQQGFEGTTVRDIEDRAGVDHALIARYYGSKADLYIAALVAAAVGDQPGSEYEGLQDMTEGLVSRMDEHGPGPVLQALIATGIDDQIRDAARAHVIRRMVDPMLSDMVRRGVAGANLRSEVVVSALIGISLGRALGWFDHLTAAPKDELSDLVTALLSDA